MGFLIYVLEEMEISGIIGLILAYFCIGFIFFGSDGWIENQAALRINATEVIAKTVFWPVIFVWGVFWWITLLLMCLLFSFLDSDPDID